MTVQITYKKNFTKSNTGNLILFVDETFNVSVLKRYMQLSEYLFVSDLLKVKKSNKEILIIDVSSKKKIILLSLKKNIKPYETEILGGKLYNFLKEIESSKFILNSDSITKNIKI